MQRFAFRYTLYSFIVSFVCQKIDLNLYWRSSVDTHSSTLFLHICGSWNLEYWSSIEILVILFAHLFPLLNSSHRRWPCQGAACWGLSFPNICITHSSRVSFRALFRFPTDEGKRVT